MNNLVLHIFHSENTIIKTRYCTNMFYQLEILRYMYINLYVPFYSHKNIQHVPLNYCRYGLKQYPINQSIQHVFYWKTKLQALLLAVNFLLLLLSKTYVHEIQYKYVFLSLLSHECNKYSSAFTINIELSIIY